MAKGSNPTQLNFRVFPVFTGILAAAVLTLVGSAVWNTGNMYQDSDIGHG